MVMTRKKKGTNEYDIKQTACLIWAISTSFVHPGTYAAFKASIFVLSSIARQGKQNSKTTDSPGKRIPFEGFVMQERGTLVAMEKATG